MTRNYVQENNVLDRGLVLKWGLESKGLKPFYLNAKSLRSTKFAQHPTYLVYSFDFKLSDFALIFKSICFICLPNSVT